jgi:hypothetical protein
MSGFLHRLAARTLGLAPQIRPRAVLPYAAPQTDFPGAEWPGQQVENDPASSDTDAAASPPPAESRENSRHQKPLPDSLLAGSPASQGMATPRPVNRTADSANSELLRGVTSAPQVRPMRFAETMHPIVSFPASQLDEGFAPEHSPLPPKTSEPIQGNAATSLDAAQTRFNDLETLVSQLLGQGKDDNQKTPPRPASDVFPASITAPLGASTIRTQASRERSSKPTHAAEPEAAPEVHITIGRLEVNPPSRPAPPPAPGPRGPAPLSLSDYLARRDGGRS